MSIVERIRKTGFRTLFLYLLVAVFILFHGYLALVKPLHPLLQSPLHWILALAVAFIKYPIYTRKEGAPKSWKDYLFIVDIIIMVMLAFLAWYFISQHQRLINRVAYLDPLKTVDIIAMFFSMALILEAVRRSIGWNLLIFIAMFMLYFFFGKNLPGILKHSGTTLSKFTDLMIMGTEGIFGTTVSFSVNYMAYFMFFGCLFAECGGGQVLIDLGFKVSKKGSSGGPAKAAVISSGLFGMASGSATGNVATTGVITIPMMKRAGYAPADAGAVEAVASTGGQIMPPVMGASAFLMAEIIGVSYLKICVAAIVPAVIYYISVFLLVTFLAKKEHAVASEEIVTEPVLPRLYLLIPMLFLIYNVVTGKSLQRAALSGIATVLIINIARWKKGVPPKEMFKHCIEATKSTATTVIPTSACGIIIGVVTMSGLANRLSAVIEKLGHGSLLPALLIAMLGCILLGMALPTLAAYLTANILFAGPLIHLGMSPLQANMFLFYFGIFAQITPPVCLASFCAAGIADAPPWKTGWTAFRNALIAFMIPYVFAYKPDLLIVLGQVKWLASIEAIGLMIVGTVFLAAGFSGWFIVTLKAWQRVVLLFGAILIVTPETITTVVGIIMCLAMVLYILLIDRRKTPQTPTPAAA